MSLASSALPNGFCANTFVGGAALLLKLREGIESKRLKTKYVKNMAKRK